MSCPICYDSYTTEQCVTTKCSHTFCKNCLEKWYINNDSCPYCRNYLELPLIFKLDSIDCSYYKFLDIKRKTKTVNGQNVSFLEKHLKNKNKIPFSWLKNPNINPLYKLETNQSDIQITLYTRLYLLYNNKNNVTITQVNDFLDNNYFDIFDPIFENYNYYTHNILYDWIFELFHVLKKEYNFIYKTVYNTLVFDLILKTIDILKCPKSLFQTVAIVSVYNSIKLLDNITISISRLIYYTDDSSKRCNFDMINEKQNMYIKNNLETLN